MITIDYTELTNLKEKLDTLNNSFQTDLRGTISEQIGDEGREILQDHAPVDTGYLRTAIQYITLFPYITIGDDVDPVDYWDFVINGTRPHIIEGNPWLYWSGASHPVRRVHHPGTKPNPFVDESIPEVFSFIEDLLVEWIDGLLENI